MEVVSSLIDLVSERLGGQALLASDEFFAPKENLLKPGRGVFIEGKYTEQGKWMDGWESRRKRGPGYDWCILRLGLRGNIHVVVVDTNHFRGNHPESFSLEGLEADPSLSADTLAMKEGWTEIVGKTKLQGHTENSFEVASRKRYTHVRLNIFPDGGVARLRLMGVVEPDFGLIQETSGLVDLASVKSGARPLACSDQFFSQPWNLLIPERAVHMGDGWETRRRRGPGHDWLELSLRRPGIIEKIEVDTNHFKGNYPDRCRLEGCLVSGGADATPLPADAPWKEILPEVSLEGHRQNYFQKELIAPTAVNRVRFHIYPDGGVSRLRLWGHFSDGLLP